MSTTTSTKAKAVARSRSPKIMAIEPKANGAEIIRVLIADDHAMVRQGIKSLLEANEGFKVIALAQDGSEAVDLAQQHQPQVAMIDARMAGLNGIDATTQIKDVSPDTAVLAVTTHDDPTSIEGMLRAGALGYIHKDTSVKNMMRAIRSIVRGEVYLCPQIARRIVEAFVLGEGNTSISPLTVLTPREREVAQLLSEGHSTRNIAERLFVSVKTVDTHRYQILKKLDLRGIADLTRLALKEGLSTLDSQRPSDD